MKKLISTLLLLTLFFQSCVVYQKTPVSIAEAVGKGPVIITDIEDDIREFDNIILIDSTYYGLNTNKTYKKTALRKDEIVAIQLIDPNKSKSINTVTVLGTVVVISLVLLVLITSLEF